VGFEEIFCRNSPAILSCSYQKVSVNTPCVNTSPEEVLKRFNTWPKVVLKQVFEQRFNIETHTLVRQLLESESNVA
jgi:hypothetical protein